MRLDDGRPFTYRQAVEAGVSRRALQSSTYRLLLRNAYIRADATVDGHVEAQAALLVAQPRAFVSHHTAARLWGGVVPHSPVAHVSVQRGRGRSQRRDVVVHASSRTPTTFRGLAVSSPLDTFLDMATQLTLVDLVILGDSLARRRRFTPDDLVRVTEQTGGRGARLARRAARLVRAGVDSPMETRARMLRVLSGLPELETDVRFFWPDGSLRRRLDSGDRPSRTAVEYDGRHHAERVEQWESDLLRREEFDDEEWRIVTLVSKDIFSSPGTTIDRLRRIFRQRGLTIGPRSQEWRRHFPDRR